jgi:type II secretory pathway component PulF
MAQLSDSQFASLLDEIACSMQVNTPIMDAMQRLQKHQPARLVRAAATIADGLERGQSLANSVASIESPLSGQAAAAIDAAANSGNTELLTRMSGQLRLRTESGRRLRLAWFYPILLAVVAYVIALLVMGPLILRFQDTGVSWPPVALRSAQWLQSNAWIPPLAMLAAVLAVVVWLAWRNRFPRDVRLQLFCQSLADQVMHDVAEDDAIRNAAKMSGDTLLQSIDPPTLASSPIKQLLSEGDVGEIAGVGAKQKLICSLQRAASLHARRAARSTYLWTRLVPRLATIVIGGGMIMAYAWLVIAPVYRQVAQW